MLLWIGRQTQEARILMSTSFVIEKKGVKHTISYDSPPQKNMVILLANGKTVGHLEKMEDGGYSAKSIYSDNAIEKDTFRTAEQYILDQHFSVLRNARGLFECFSKSRKRSSKRCTPTLIT